MKKLRLILITLAALIGLAALASLTWYQLQLRQVNGKDKSAVSFDLPRGEKSTATAKRLESAKLIRSDKAFLIYISLKGIRTQLQAGSYSLSPSRSAPEVAAILSQGKISTNLLVIPEGKTVDGVAALAKARGVDISSALSDRYGYAFLTDAPSLEGFLFPDSYQITKTTTPHVLINEMLTNFNDKVPARFEAPFKLRGLSLEQGVTLASIVEREANNSADRQMVAQVFLKRLSIGMALESDVTVDYASKLTGQPFSVDLDSPYNTYKNTGLPPGPICNPGLSSLEAVTSPAKTDYLYFVTGADGKTRFATTFGQQQANINQYGLLTK